MLSWGSTRPAALCGSGRSSGRRPTATSCVRPSTPFAHMPCSAFRRAEPMPRSSLVLYLAIAADDAAAVAVHRFVEPGRAHPFIATPSGLQIRRTLAPSTARPVTVAWDRLADPANLPPELTSLTAIALSSSVVWRDFVTDRSNRVDAALLKAIKSLNEAVRHNYPALRQQPALVNALIGRFIYFFVLLDRKIIGGRGSPRSRTRQARPFARRSRPPSMRRAASTLWTGRGRREVWSLFDKIDDVLNGTIFPISTTDRRLIPADALHLVRRAIRHGDVIGRVGRQLGFLDVSFSTLRTETISAIYELPPDRKSRGKGRRGAFYTPPFLVDYVLDEINRIRPFTGKSRVVDRRQVPGSPRWRLPPHPRARNAPTPMDGLRIFRKARSILEKRFLASRKIAKRRTSRALACPFVARLRRERFD